MPEFTNLVFAGGGSRCFWQAGFWSVFSASHPKPPARVVGVSAGAAMACLIFAGRIDAGLSDFKRRTAANRRNFYPTRLVSRAGAFPHERIYREAILSSIDPSALRQLHGGPRIQIMMARLPPKLTPRVATIAGITAYSLERRLRPMVHPYAGRALGFRFVSCDAHSCETPERLADAILASSGAPPFTPVAKFRGDPVLDGGLVDNVPVEPIQHEPGRTLVLLSRRYGQLPQTPHRTYVQPSRPVPVSMWDYTNPQAIQEAFELGCRDAEAFVAAKAPGGTPTNPLSIAG